MRMRHATPVLIASMFVLAAISGRSLAQQSVATDGTLVSVQANADVTRVPDVATVSAGVVTQAADANAAMRANAAEMDKVMSAIRAAGIAERDIQTSGINLNPQYRYAENQPPVITGYQASNTVSLKVRDIGKLGKVLDALVASGANQVNGPMFEIDVPEAAYDEGRRAALAKGAGAGDDVRRGAGPAGAADREHRRRRRLPPTRADADDGDGARGKGRGVRHRGVAWRNDVVGQPQRGVRAGALRWPGRRDLRRIFPPPPASIRAAAATPATPRSRPKDRGQAQQLPSRPGPTRRTRHRPRHRRPPLAVRRRAGHPFMLHTGR